MFTLLEYAILVFKLLSLYIIISGDKPLDSTKIQDDVQIAQDVLSAADVDAACYRIGPSQVSNIFLYYYHFHVNYYKSRFKKKSKNLSL